MRKLTDAEKAELQKKIEIQRQDQTARFRDKKSNNPVSSDVKVRWIVVGTVLYGVSGVICVLPLTFFTFGGVVIIGGIFSAIIGALIGNQAPRSNIAKVAIFIPPVLTVLCAVLWIWWFLANLDFSRFPSD